MPHLSYLFCTTWGRHLAGPVTEIGLQAIGGVPDPIELIEEAGMTDRHGRLVDGGTAASGNRPEDTERMRR